MVDPMKGLDGVTFAYAAGAFLVCYFITKKLPAFLIIPALLVVIVVGGALITHR
jgi:hypothetical protein